MRETSVISFDGYSVKMSSDGLSFKTPFGEFLRKMKVTFYFKNGSRLDFPMLAEGIGAMNFNEPREPFTEVDVYSRDIKFYMRIIRGGGGALLAYGKVGEEVELKDPPAVMELSLPNDVTQLLVYKRGRKGYAIPFKCEDLESLSDKTLLNHLFFKKNSLFFLLAPLNSTGYISNMKKHGRELYLTPISMLETNKGDSIPFVALIWGKSPYNLFNRFLKLQNQLMGLSTSLRSEKTFPNFLKRIGINCRNLDDCESFLAGISEKFKAGYVLIGDHGHEAGVDLINDLDMRRVSEKMRSLDMKIGLEINFRSIIDGNKIYKAFDKFLDFLGLLRKHGIRFVKIFDGQVPEFKSSQIPLMEITSLIYGGFEEAAKRKNMSVINCLPHLPEFYLNATFSPVFHAGDDEEFKDARVYMYSCILNSLWLSAIAWPDYGVLRDGRDTYLGLILRSLSGAPIYVSPSVLKKLSREFPKICLSDGRVLRPDAPALPTVDSIFSDPLNGNEVLKVFTRIRVEGFGDVGVVGVFNLNLKNATLKYTVKVKEDTPVKGDKFLVYEGISGVFHAVDADKTISGVLRSYGAKVYVISPIRKGIAPIGLTSKYLAPLGIVRLNISERKVLLEAVEHGPLALYVEETPKTVEADGKLFKLQDCVTKFGEGYLVRCHAKVLEIFFK
ncbi:MAG: hypothetical protein DRJ47_09065 [Thermoprotei archaeon]|nr:MAG: hypothetical protein DRJ47_09065 [Thermoprotei archaeon]